MYLPLKIILLGVAVGSAMPAAITPQQHHDASESKHEIQDRPVINVKFPPSEVPEWSILADEFDKCDIPSHVTCLRSGGRDCEAELDRSGECDPFINGLIQRLVQRDNSGIFRPESETKLITRDPDPPIPMPMGYIGNHDPPMPMDYLGHRPNWRDFTMPMDYTPKWPAPPIAMGWKPNADTMVHKRTAGTMVHERNADVLVHYDGQEPEIWATNQTPTCLYNCLLGPADGPEENRERAECVRRCAEEAEKEE